MHFLNHDLILMTQVLQLLKYEKRPRPRTYDVKCIFSILICTFGGSNINQLLAVQTFSQNLCYFFLIENYFDFLHEKINEKDFPFLILVF